MKRAPFPPNNTVAVDVDGTLHTNGFINPAVVALCEKMKADGYRLTLWSARGEDYAKTAAETFGVAHLFHAIVGKPAHILDDQGWDWIRYTKVLPMPSPANLPPLTPRPL